MFVTLLSLLGYTASAQEVYNDSFEIDEGGGNVWNLSNSTGQCKQRGGDDTDFGTEVMEVKDFAYCESDAFWMTTEEIRFYAAGKDNDDQLATIAVFADSGGPDLAVWGPVYLTRDSKDSGLDAYILDTSAACGTYARIEARNLGAESGGNGNKDWVLDNVKLDHSKACPEYTDGDNDGFCPYGTDQGGAYPNCAEPEDDQSATVVDCDDTDDTVYPGAPEICDGKDNDCDGSVDEGIATLDYYPDLDDDGFGDDSAPPEAFCSDPGHGYALNAQDCDDSDFDVKPGAAIVPMDAIDNDCSGGRDECYADTDGDHYGDGAAFVDTSNASCLDPGEADNPDDCDDSRALTNPGENEETCNGEDDDCNAGTPDAPDVDDDTYSVCDGDCDDADATIHPDADPVVGDGLDNDCSGGVDECYRDVDGDDYGIDTIIDSADADCDDNNEALVPGDCNDSLSAVNPGEQEVLCNNRNDDCASSTPDKPDDDNDGFDVCGGNADCDDTDPDVRPGAPELCDGLDNDCSGAPAANEADGDGDGVRICDGDCVDSDAAIHPGLPEDPCDGRDNDCSTNGVPDPNEVDNDGDGYAECDVQSDCDDTDPSVNVDGVEICNNKDDDCSGTADNGLTFLDYYADADSDGYGDETADATSSCQPIAGQVTDHTDCDDGASTTYPGAPEQCDGIDNDCDGVPDDGTADQTYYADLDGDGFGDPNGSTLVACSAQPGFVPNASDCDDTDETIHPNATELCDAVDRNCDGDPVGGLPQVAYYLDVDGDGFGDQDDLNPQLSCAPVPGRVADDSDCNDSSALVSPGAPELCDGVDNDCNGVDDNGLLFRDYREDLDGDGFGAGIAVSACSPYLDWVVSPIDCDDAAAGVHPGAAEICDGIDNDCDLGIDENLPEVEWYADLDDDGFGAGSVTIDCALPADGASLLSSDCDDTNAFVNPLAAEQCDGIDNNCDGLDDNGVVAVDWYLDLDDDGFGDDSVPPVSNCAAPGPEYVEVAGDCDDGDETFNPSEHETCAPGDQDCDGAIDEDDPDLIAPSWYRDQDGDGYGSNFTQEACEAPSGFVAQSGDCDDDSNGVRPGALEVCPDGLDNDCDGLVDAADPDYIVDAITFWADTDGDGVGTPAGGATVCPGPDLPSFFVLPSGAPDCDDNDELTFPNAPETCNGVDNDCNGLRDDGLPTLPYYPDLDGDGFGDDAGSADYCHPDIAALDGMIATGGDCDDDDDAIHPLAVEICGDGIDQDCDGVEPQPFDQWPDADGDGFGDATVSAVSDCAALSGYVQDATDCDDGAFEVNPAATEVCNEVDDDCDPATPEPTRTYYRDVDLDQVGVEDEVIEACEPPDETWATVYGDCAPDDAQRTDCVIPSKDAGCQCSAVGWTPSLVGWLRR